MPLDRPQAEPLSEREEHDREHPPMVTRAPEERDLSALAHIDAEWSGRPRRAYLEARLRRAVRPAGINLSRVAELDGEIVGFLFGEVTRGEFGRVDAMAWIDTFGVRKDRARRGVGKALLHDFMRHAEVLGAQAVRTLLDPEDDVLTSFLESQDFHVAATKVVERVVEGDVR